VNIKGMKRRAANRPMTELTLDQREQIWKAKPVHRI
jgi:hypothetical protein